MRFREMPSHETLNALLQYDPETGSLYWKHRTEEWFPSGGRFRVAVLCAQWNSKYAGKEAFTSKNLKGYKIGAVLGQGLLAHRVIWKMEHGSEPADQIDHINGNPSDNRLCNLREATAAENAQNRKRAKINTSGAVGVVAEGGGWRAQIKVGGRSTRLGLFKTKGEAERAYASAKKVKHLFQPVARERAEERGAA